MKVAIAIIALAALTIISTQTEVYAQEASVSIPQGAATADCREDFSNECYNPGALTISPGTTVTWTNDDNTSHTVTSGISFGLASDPRFKDKTAGPDGLFDSGIMAPGAEFSFTFNDEGEYNYFCSLHPFMVGQVIVQAGGGGGETMNTINFETNLALPYDREANDSITLTFSPSGADIEGHHLDYHIIITRDGETVWEGTLHDHDGTLDLIIMPGEGEVSVSGGEASEGNASTAPYTISGAVFNENGDYTVTAEITGIDHTPLQEPIATNQFSVSVVPEFPLAAIIPMVIGFSAVLAVMRMRKTNLF